jgi:hypothetical protein
MAGGGWGGGASKPEGGNAGIAAIAAVDVVWRRSETRALTFSFEAAGFSEGGRAPVFPDPHPLDSASHLALLVGLERSRALPAVQRFVQLGTGLGRVEGSVGASDKTYVGLAVGATAGLRIAPPPGPLGFVIGFRTSHVLATDLRSHAVALSLGLAIHPR